MSLKDRIRSAQAPVSKDSLKGFRLARPRLLHFKEAPSFVTAVKDQSDHLAMMDAKPLSRVGIDGRIGKTDWSLSFAAFSDMCHYSRIPVRFVKDLAKYNEQLALDVVEEMLRYRFHVGQDKLLVVDTRDGRVEGIVGKETYSPITHMDVIDFALSANPALEFTNGWVSGPAMRMTAVFKTNPVEAKKGDVLWIGTSVENALNGDRSVKIHDYNERLSCTNGMTSYENMGWNRIEHRGDVEFKVQQAVVKSADRATALVPVMKASTMYFPGPEAIRDVRKFISNGKNGGSPKLDRKATNEAMNEAMKEGRKEEEVSLWNFVNGVTASAHDEDSLQRKNEIEALGYRTLVRFGAALVN